MIQYYFVASKCQALDRLSISNALVNLMYWNYSSESLLVPNCFEIKSNACMHSDSDLKRPLTNLSNNIFKNSISVTGCHTIHWTGALLCLMIKQLSFTCSSRVGPSTGARKAQSLTSQSQRCIPALHKAFRTQACIQLANINISIAGGSISEGIYNLTNAFSFILFTKSRPAATVETTCSVQPVQIQLRAPS